MARGSGDNVVTGSRRVLAIPEEVAVRALADGALYDAERQARILDVGQAERFGIDQHVVEQRGDVESHQADLRQRLERLQRLLERAVIGRAQLARGRLRVGAQGANRGVIARSGRFGISRVRAPAAQSAWMLPATAAIACWMIPMLVAPWDRSRARSRHR
jgi:hypothetical protein